MCVSMVNVSVYIIYVHVRTWYGTCTYMECGTYMYVCMYVCSYKITSVIFSLPLPIFFWVVLMLPWLDVSVYIHGMVHVHGMCSYKMVIFSHPL